MDLEKAYDRVDREALWSVLKIYGVGGQLLRGIQASYREAKACVRVGGKEKKEEGKERRGRFQERKRMCRSDICNEEVSGGVRRKR